ncbi:hypothetical protein EV421DRAFT_1157858 [Armillaria borealis]|uniref:Uncharacterized protein n=1 Tax=Armillaria borealis TaxID=47425 RepID=A0AA39MIS9_9AGAR|nr:hypothetical protein EV421DRAFT_1157858 [Armillaria borealis]
METSSSSNDVHGVQESCSRGGEKRSDRKHFQLRPTRSPPDKLLLFYSKQKGEMEGAACVLNLANASEDSLHNLCKAADAAGFGLGNHNKFDETYRKSKELDTSRFACNFDPRTTKIFDQVHTTG